MPSCSHLPLGLWCQTGITNYIKHMLMTSVRGAVFIRQPEWHRYVGGQTWKTVVHFPINNACVVQTMLYLLQFCVSFPSQIRHLGKNLHITYYPKFTILPILTLSIASFFWDLVQCTVNILCFHKQKITVQCLPGDQMKGRQATFWRSVWTAGMAQWMRAPWRWQPA